MGRYKTKGDHNHPEPKESTMPEMQDTKEATVTEKLSVMLSFEEWKGRFRDIEVSLLEDNGGEFVEITQGDETIHVPPQAIEDLCNAMVKVT
jgi:hypothetical protein